MTVRVAVVGGGIAGLAAALRLRDRLGPAADITVYEQGGVLGGKLRTGTAGGLVAERGADAFLVRSADGSGAESAAVGLARRVGLADDLVHPEPVPAGLWLDGALHPYPPGTLLGVPGDLAAVAAVAAVAKPAGAKAAATAAAAAAAERDRDGGRPLLGAGEDVAVGELVRRRLGDEVVERLVDPMLGGVYAGRADTLSLATTMPGLAAACRTETTLVGAVRAAQAASPRPAGAPVFASVRGGLGRLVDAVVASAVAGGVRMRLGRPVRSLAGAGRGWRLVVGSTRDPEEVEADAVVLALPARPAARLLHDPAPPAADLVGALDYASVALVTLALPASTVLPSWSGFLVPPGEGGLVKAVTFLTRKWGHLRGDGDPVLVRASVGRYGEPGPLRLADAALAEQVHAELARMLAGMLSPAAGLPAVRVLPPPVDTHVQRWGGALPQYAPGHLDRVGAARAALPDTVQLAGAGYDGVGIPACIRSGETAADRVAAVLGESQV